MEFLFAKICHNDINSKSTAILLGVVLFLAKRFVGICQVCYLCKSDVLYTSLLGII